MTDINTPEAIAPPEVDAAPVEVTALGIAERAAVDETARANEAANADLVSVVVATTHHLGTSLLHADSQYIEYFENGAPRIEQVIGR